MEDVSQTTAACALQRPCRFSVLPASSASDLHRGVGEALLPLIHQDWLLCPRMPDQDLQVQRHKRSGACPQSFCSLSAPSQTLRVFLLPCSLSTTAAPSRLFNCSLFLSTPSFLQYVYMTHPKYPLEARNLELQKIDTSQDFPSVHVWMYMFMCARALVHLHACLYSAGSLCRAHGSCVSQWG